MTASDPIDAPRLNLLLNELRLPAIKHLWSAFTERTDKEGWPAAPPLCALAEHEIAEHEIAERGQRRIEWHLAEARLPPGKTLSGFNFPVLTLAPFADRAPGTCSRGGHHAPRQMPPDHSR